MKTQNMAAGLLAGMVMVVGTNASAFAAEPSQGPGVMERIEATAKKVGKKIEEGFTKTTKKIEDKHIGDKIEQKLRKAANKTAEGFEKAGNKIEQKLGN